MDDLTCGTGGFYEDDDGDVIPCVSYQPDLCLLNTDGSVTSDCSNSDFWEPPVQSPIFPDNTGDDSGAGSLSVYQNALNTLKTFSTSSPKCLKDLKAVGMTVSQVDSLALSVNFVSYTVLNPLEQQRLMSNGADLATNFVSNTIFYVGPNLANLSLSAALGEMLHELIHDSGFGAVGGVASPQQDLATQAALHLKQTLSYTDNISKKLTKDCFRSYK